MDELLTVFVHEAHEKLDEMEAGLLAIEQGDADPETLNAVFRAAHTVKGSSGVVEISAIERFTHVLENLLDQLRDGLVATSPELIGLILAACDHIRSLLENIEQLQGGQGGELEEKGSELAAQLSARLHRADAAPDAEPAAVTGEDGASEAAGECSASDNWHLSVRFGPGILCQGMDPASFLRQLGSIGNIRHLFTLLDAMPDAEDMDAEACYLGFEIALADATDQSSITRVFTFIEDECSLHIIPPHSPVDRYLALIDALPEPGISDILLQTGALSQQQLDKARQQAAAAEAGVPAAISPRSGGNNDVAGMVPAGNGDKRTAESSRLIRVQADKLDRLIDLVGELVIAGASAQLLARQSGQSTLAETTATLSRLVEDVRGTALQLRMVTIGETFNRFQRVVRDTARDTGKDITLVLHGGDTELDKSVVERLADPLLHLVRNAIDHGIESTEARLASGKSATGTVTLNAFHDSGNVVIEISDDGGGLNTERIRAKAIERGLIDAAATMTDQEIHHLIFEPGFSTAEQVTNLSGRGVGMDVVKKNITALRGSIEVYSSPQQGSRFVLRLPLTLAIIDGFLVGVQGAAYVIPLVNVVECLELKPEETLGNVLHLRGSALPFLRLRDMFGVSEHAPRRENVVVVQAAGQRAGIVVDQLLGEFQTVIKPLGQLFRHLRGVAGSTILGSGDVALILDVDALSRRAAQQESAALHAVAAIR